MKSLIVAISLSLAIAAPKAQAYSWFSGYVDWIKDDTLIVDGQRVKCQGPCYLNGASGLGAITLGSPVRVWSPNRLPDGSISASSITIWPPKDGFIQRHLKAAMDTNENEFVTKNMFTLEGVGAVGTLSKDQAKIQRVRTIIDKVSPPYVDRSALKVHIVENKEWNAMAAPNGAFYVYTGMLDDFDDDELAIVLGHEVAHYTYQHGSKAIREALVRTAVVIFGTVLINAILQANSESQDSDVDVYPIVSFASMVFANGYSRTHEEQSDRVGLRYAYEAGYDVSKAPRMWQRFEEKYGTQSKMVNFLFGDHPTSEQRAVTLNQEMVWNYPRFANKW